MFSFLLSSIPFIALFSTVECFSLDWKNCTLEKFPALNNLGVPDEYISLLGTAPNLDCAELEVSARGLHQPSWRENNSWND